MNHTGLLIQKMVTQRGNILGTYIVCGFANPILFLLEEWVADLVHATNYSQDITFNINVIFTLKRLLVSSWVVHKQRSWVENIHLGYCSLVLKKSWVYAVCQENISFHVFVHCQLIFIEYLICAWNHGILGQQNLPSLEVYLACILF